MDKVSKHEDSFAVCVGVGVGGCVCMWRGEGKQKGDYGSYTIWTNFAFLDPWILVGYTQKLGQIHQYILSETVPESSFDK